MKKLLLLSTILLSLIMVKAQKHAADSVYLYDKTGKYYKTEAATKATFSDKKNKYYNICT